MSYTKILVSYLIYENVFRWNIGGRRERRRFLSFKLHFFEIISYLKDKKVIVLTDPDEAGQKIRHRLNELLPNATNVEIDIKRCIRNVKNGVAECDINEVLTKLKPYSTNQKNSKSDITMNDLYNLGLMNNKDLRDSVCAKLNIGKCNAKTMYKRLLNNNIKLEQLYEIMK